MNSGIRFRLLVCFSILLGPAPYEGLCQNMGMYDLAGLIKYIYKGDEILEQAIVNTECRNPYVHVFLKTLQRSLAELTLVDEVIVKDKDGNDVHVNIIRPPLGERSKNSIKGADQNDVIKLIADTLPTNRLSFSNAVESLDYFYNDPQGAISREVGGPGFPGGDVFFRDATNKLISIHEHKSQDTLILNGNNFESFLNKGKKQFLNAPEFEADPSINANLILQLNPANTQTDAQIENVMEGQLEPIRKTNCKRKFQNITFTVQRPDGHFIVFKEPICP